MVMTPVNVIFISFAMFLLAIFDESVIMMSNMHK